MSDPELVGSWRLMCSNILYQAVESRCSSHISGRRHMTYRAERWLRGGVGQITYEDCCEALGLDPEVTREKIQDYLKAPPRKPAFKRDQHAASAKKYWSEKRQAQKAEAGATP